MMAADLCAVTLLVRADVLCSHVMSMPLVGAPVTGGDPGVLGL